MKKYMIFMFLMVISLNIIGCNKQMSLKNPNPNPILLTEEYYLGYNPIGVENEVNYDNISLKKLDGEGLAQDNKMVFEIKNNNKGKGFYYYYIPLLEYYDGDAWVRLSYYPPETQYDEQWYFCGIENKTDIEFSTWITFIPQYVMEKMIPGKYRIVQFVGPTVCYCEFEMR